MLSADTTSSPGAAPLSFGKDFNCNATICYGIGTNHSILLSLQSLINKYAAAAGFAPLGVDGKIGDGTIKAFRKAAAWIKAKGGNAPFTVDGRDVSTFDNLAITANARDLIKTLDFWSTSLPKLATPVPVPKAPSGPGLPVPVPGSTPAPGMPVAPAQPPFSIQLPPNFSQTPSAGSFGPPPASSPATVVAPATSSSGVPWWAWALGGVALAGGVTAVVLTSRKRKQRR